MKNKVMAGFTIIELLLVISIIAILSTISFASFNGSIIRGRDTVRKSDLSQLRKALEAYNTQFGDYPDSDTTNHTVMGCMDSPVGSFIECPAANGAFRYYVGNEEEMTLLKYPADPAVNRFYYYQGPNELGSGSYTFYASLENTQDKDVKMLNGDPDPDGWGIDCGSARCNYKITNAGLEQ